MLDFHSCDSFNPCIEKKNNNNNNNNKKKKTKKQKAKNRKLNTK